MTTDTHFHLATAIAWPLALAVLAWCWWPTGALA